VPVLPPAAWQRQVPAGAPPSTCCITGCKRMCLFLILLVYLLSGVLPLPSTIDLLRDLVDPENVLLDAAVVALRRRAIVVEPTVSPPQDVGSAAAPEIAPVVAPERPTESLLLLGERLAKDGLRRRHPVVFVPGITSSGLELWSGLPCARRHFRQRLWGDVAQANKLLVSVDCWLQHMRLDNATGTDPPGVRLRAASGLAAADVVMGAYSLWAGLVQQLAALGYDEAMIHLAAYDWRLRFDLLEERDRYFSKLKAQVELMSEVAGGRPVVFVSHSMGFNVVSYFFQWVHSRAATGRQCPHLPAAERAAREASWSQADTDGALPAACDGWWARRYIRTWVNLAGSAAGSPKGLVSWYSGQMGNLAAVNPLFGAMLEQYLPKRSLRELWRSFQSMTALLPMGGARVWGGRVGKGGTRAPWSGWAAPRRGARRVGGSRQPAPGAAGDGVSPPWAANGTFRRVPPPPGSPLYRERVPVSPLDVAGMPRRRLAAPAAWFAAPDEAGSSGPVGRGVFSLRRAVSWERHDPGAVVSQLLSSFGSYLPAVWSFSPQNPDPARNRTPPDQAAAAPGPPDEAPPRAGGALLPAGDAPGAPAAGSPGPLAARPGGLNGSSDDVTTALFSSLARAVRRGSSRGTSAIRVRAGRERPTPPAHPARPGPGAAAQMALDSALRLAGFADHNGDGVVTADESLQDALDRAGFIDVDGDGSVSLEEAVTQALSPHGAGATPPGQDDEPYGEPELSEPAEHEDADGAAAEHGQAASGVDSLTGAIESAGDFHLSVEEVFDMMRVQDGGFMGQIDSFVDLNAWRPPSQAELDRATPPRPDGSRRYRATAGGLPRRYWSNPLSAPLPDAPSMTVLCLYGVGRPVERHYNMLAVRARPQEAWVDLEEAAAAGNDTIAVHGSALAPVPVEIASGFHRDPAAPDRGPRANGTRRRGAPSSGVGKPRGRGGPGRVSSGVTYTDGDGTVPAISLSLLCERHFRSREGNPGRARVVTRELPFTSSGGIEEELEGIAHTVRGAEAGEDEAAAEAGAEAAQWLEHITQAGLVRGTVDYLRSQGGATSEHIDILLNGRVMEAVVREAAGQDGAASASQWLSRRTRVTLGRATANLEGLTPWAEEEWAA